MLSKIIHSSLLLFITTALLKFSMFVISILVARYTGKEAFGQYMIIRNTISSIELFPMLGINQTSIKFIAKVEKKTNQLPSVILIILFIILITTLIVSISLFIFATNFSSYFFNSIEDEFINGIKIGSFILFFSIYSTILTSILTGLDKYKEIVGTNLYSTIIFLIPSVILIKEFHLIGALYSVLLFFIFSSLFKTLKIITSINLKTFKIKYNYFKKKFWGILYFSIPIFLSIIIIMPIFWYSKTLLISSTEKGFIEIANFEAAYQLLTIILVITGSVANVALSTFSKLLKNQLKKILITNIIINLFISIFLSLIFIYFGKELLNIYGKNFNDVLLLKILILASIPFTMQSILNRFLTSVSKVWVNFTISFIWFSVFSVLIFIDLNNLTSIILAKAFLISYIISCIISFLYVINYFIKIKK